LEVHLSQAFLEYGLWQDYGTGKEVTRGNSSWGLLLKHYRKSGSAKCFD